ncbi:YbhN family protein [Leifsonia sp. 2TAF2]|uniref:lysylphosphatidylglycerol synthase transmembrane domain-containing protein n=1 Tax=Leifsonia sp. 2TAF2 TaxID=3233009 RepID=UPI003F9B84C3
MTRLAAAGVRIGGIVRSRRFLLIARYVVAATALAAVVVRVGAGPFLHGLLSLRPPLIVAALALAFVGTAAAAWRWHVVAGRLSVGLGWRRAVGMYYRSQFLNTVLPGGVLGDVHRAVDHGRSTDSLGKAAQAVAGERIAGQVVQFILTVGVLLAVGGTFGGALFPGIGIGLAVLAVVVAAVTAVVAAVSARSRGALGRAVRWMRTAAGDPAAVLQIVAASVIVVACHVATFALAAVAVGAQVPPARLVTLAVVVLLAASIPVNIGGWGPREGVAAWAFALGGSTAATGVSAATLMGVLAIVSVIPGVLVAALAPLISRRTSRVRSSLRDRQLRRLPRRLPRLGRPAAPAAVERGRLRPGG